jgi:hypothetical protein
MALGPPFLAHRFNVRCHIFYVTRAEFSAKCRHCVFPIGHLVLDGFLMTSTVVRQMGFERILFERPLGVYNVAATHVTGSAVR